MVRFASRRRSHVARPATPWTHPHRSDQGNQDSTNPGSAGVDTPRVFLYTHFGPAETGSFRSTVHLTISPPSPKGGVPGRRQRPLVTLGRARGGTARLHGSRTARRQAITSQGVPRWLAASANRALSPRPLRRQCYPLKPRWRQLPPPQSCRCLPRSGTRRSPSSPAGCGCGSCARPKR